MDADDWGTCECATEVDPSTGAVTGTVPIANRCNFMRPVDYDEQFEFGARPMCVPGGCVCHQRSVHDRGHAQAIDYGCGFADGAVCPGPVIPRTETGTGTGTGTEIEQEETDEEDEEEEEKKDDQEQEERKMGEGGMMTILGYPLLTPHMLFMNATRQERR